MFMDLSKAFDTIEHDLVIAKLGAYDFEDAFVFIKSYFTNRQQRIRVKVPLVVGGNNFCSSARFNNGSSSF